MKKITLFICAILTFSLGFAQSPEGEWKMIPEAGALGVGSAQGMTEFFSNSAADVMTRDCYFDDLFQFNGDGSFNNLDDGQTWLETWQGVPNDQCGASVAPHDNSNAATWSYDDMAGTLTLNGTGAYLGIPKAVNGGELPGVPVPASITYLVTELTSNSMTLDIDVGGAWWRFRLIKDLPPTCDDGMMNGDEEGVDCGGTFCPPCEAVTLDGDWQMVPEAGALGVGSAQGMTEFFSNSAADVMTRDCYFDDLFQFNGDGSFNNLDDGQTWLETWQGVPNDQCGASVAPHDNSNAATWSYDDMAGTLTLNGIGAYLGIPKAVNGGELPGVPVPASITYLVTELTSTNMTLDIDVGGAWWRFRLQKVEAGPGGPFTELVGNGSFETGDFTDWQQEETAANQQTVSMMNPSEGVFAANINNEQPGSSSGIKSANRGIGIVNPGDQVTIKFDMRGSTGAGGVVFAELFSELAGGGTSASEILGGGPVFPDADPNVWTSFEFTTTVGVNVDGGITLRFGAVTGQDPASFANVWFDNVSMVNNDEVLSVDDVTVNLDLRVYPNPTLTTWTIASSNNQNLTSVIVFDLLGKEVFALQPNTTEVTLDASELRSGIYLARLSTANGTKTVKLVKN